MKSKVVLHSVAAVLLLLGASAVRAADAESKSNGAVATYGQLDELRSQNAMLEASIKNAELRSKLSNGGKAQAAQDMGASPAPTPHTLVPAPVQASNSVVSAAPAASPASVELVASDAEGRLAAILVLQDGRKVKAHVGTEVAGLGVIRSISIDDVVVVGKTGKLKGKLIPLPFASEPTLGNSNGGMVPAQPMPGLSTVMPPLPPMMRGVR